MNAEENIQDVHENQGIKFLPSIFNTLLSHLD